MEVPRELQIYIYRFLYDKWRPVWKEVMQELMKLECKTRIWTISRFMIKEWKLKKTKEIKICLECGHFYSLPLYGSLAMWCDCP